MNKRCMGCMETYSEEYDICPYCGYVESAATEEAIHMQPGTLLHSRYIIGRVLGFGGFGVTYIAWDGRLEQKVAIKEYLPSEFSTRMPGQTMVTVFNGDKSEQFQEGLKKFVDEAKRLAKFQNASGIVKIFDSFNENETAYIVMELLEGETLTERLKREKTIQEDEAVDIIRPILSSLQAVHNAGIIHRDIAPDNIFLTTNGEVKLIDFGASRFATTTHSRSLTVIIKPGYSPEEQYRSRGDQGPHTDVYSLAAVLYKMLTGKTPPDAMERRAKIETQKKDLLEDPCKLNRKISKCRRNAILNAMNVRVEDRTPDMPTFEQELYSSQPAARKYGKIRKIDLYTWPMWLKVSLIGLAAAACAFCVLLATGTISFSSLFSSEVVVPDKTVAVPDVENLNKDDAIKQLEAMKILSSASGNVESEYIEAGKVVFQTPNAGSYVYEYGTVYLTISSGKAVEQAVDGVSTVPYVIWDTRDVAITKLQMAGLSEPEIIEIYSSDDAGKVIDQSIASGTEVAEGTRITITVSLGPEQIVVPSVKNQSEQEAIALFESLGLKVAVETDTSDEILAGNVMVQSFEAGATAKPGDTVVITVSKGQNVKLAEADINRDAEGNSSDSENSKGPNSEISNEKNEGKNPEHTHSYASSILVKETCGTEGQRLYTCSCGDSRIETIPSNGKHSYVSRIIVEPQVGKEGTKEFTCLVCNRQYTDPVPALEEKIPTDVKLVSNDKTQNDKEKPTPTPHVHSYSSRITVYSGCETYGEQTYSCTCGARYTKSIDPLGHDYVAAAYNQPGEIKYTCSRCNQSYTKKTEENVKQENDVADDKQDTPEKFHVHDYEYVKTVEETCGSAGNIRYTCICGDSFNQVIQPTGNHIYTTEILSEPGIGREGSKKVTCEVCGESHYETIEALAHVHDYKANVVLQESCGATGLWEYVCECGDKYTKTVNPTGNHDYQSSVTVKETCGTPGVRTFICKGCGNTYTETIATGGSHSYVEETTKAATCGAAGERRFTCSVCGDTYSEAIQPTGSHKYVETLIKKETCSEAGEKQYKCSVCGDTYSEAIQPTGSHKYVETLIKKETCSKAGEKQYKCSVCGDTYSEAIQPTGSHKYVETVIKKETCSKAGEKQYKCSVCGDAYTSSIPATGIHSYTSKDTVPAEVGKPGTRVFTCSVCGDSYSETISAKTLSDWTEIGKVPSGAEIKEQKWVYTRKETKDSTNSSESGWEKTGEGWTQTGTGSVRYAGFPGGYSTDDWYYQNFNKGPLEAYENATKKREVSNSFYGYIYWHWMYNVSYANTTARAISPRSGMYDQYGKNSGSAFGYYYFYAFESTANCSYLDNYYCCSNNMPSYNCAGYIPDTSVTGVGTPRFFRFETYTSYYTDYQKVYHYQKLTSGLESSTEVYVGGDITQVTKYVKYIK